MTRSHAPDHFAFLLLLLMLQPFLEARAASLAAALGNTCVISSVGAVECWGSNVYGQSGIRTEPNPALPDAVDDLPIPASHVSGFGEYVCALAGAGMPYCWGYNGDGALGDGTRNSRALPQPVLGVPTPASDLVAGVYHACAISSGVVRCWGRNDRGQLGDRTTTERLTGVAVTLPEAATAVVAGYFFTCARGTSGAVYCWGDNSFGQLGAPAPNPSLPAVAVSGGHQFTRIAAGAYHVCGRTPSGAAYCWGLGGQGQIGRGFYGDAPAPAPVQGLSSGVDRVAAGGTSSCALLTDGTVRCWGSNDSGQLGDGSTVERLVPSPVVGLGTAIAEVDSSGGHACALSLTGEVQCWGSNSAMQLGEGPPSFRPTPVDVTTLSAVTQVDADVSHTCAVANGGAFCWGDNFNGMLGDGTDRFRLVPTPVVGLASGVTMVAAGRVHACALRGGAVSCWGDGNSGQLGHGAFSDAATPQSVASLGNTVASITTSGFHSCARTTGGAARCWGANGDGQLGNNTFAASHTPVGVTGLSTGVTALASGGGTSFVGEHTCALVNGGVRCWGSNAVGQLGNGGTSDSPVPVNVTGLGTGVAAISAGEGISCAVLIDGSVRCWGRNQSGQLGNGVPSAFESTPVVVAGLGEQALEVLPGEDYVCVRSATQRLRCFGDGSFGRTGNGSQADSLAPVEVLRTSEGVVAASAGRWFGCAIVTGGRLRCWGYNFNGQLGNNECGFFAKPIASRSLLESNAAQQSLAGGAVAAIGDLVVAGVPGDGVTTSGRVLIYQRGPGGALDPPASEAKHAMFPAPVTLTWTRDKAVQEIGDKFGAAVAIAPDGATIAVGAPLASDTGRVLVYRRIGLDWTNLGVPDEILQATPNAGTTPASFGETVAFAPDGTLVVGAPASNVATAAQAGTAYLFARSTGSYVQSAELRATVPGAAAAFGSALDVDAETIAIGAPSESGQTGAVYTFARSAPATATRVAPAGAVTGDKFGASVLVRGDRIIVGAPGTDQGTDTDVGAAHVVRRGQAPTLDDVLRPAEPLTRGFGESLGESAGTLVVGAPLAIVSGRANQGRAVLYDIPEADARAANIRRVRAVGSASNRTNDAFGSALAVSPAGVIVGVPFHDEIEADGSQSPDVGRLDVYPLDRVHRSGFEL